MRRITFQSPALAEVHPSLTPRLDFLLVPAITVPNAFSACTCHPSRLGYHLTSPSAAIFCLLFIFFLPHPSPSPLKVAFTLTVNASRGISLVSLDTTKIVTNALHGSASLCFFGTFWDLGTASYSFFSHPLPPSGCVKSARIHHYEHRLLQFIIFIDSQK